MAAQIWVSIGSGYGVLPDGTNHYLNQCWLIISKASYERNGVSNYRPFDCLFDSLFKLSIKGHQSSVLLSLCSGNPSVAGDTQSVSVSWWCYYVINENVFHIVNSSRPRYNGRHFPDNIFKRIFLNENLWIATKILLKFIPQDPIKNIPTLARRQAIDWTNAG